MAGIKDPDLRKRAMKRIEKEQAKSRGEEMFPKLVEHKGDVPVIRDQLPTIFHAKGPPGQGPAGPQDTFTDYRDTLPAPTSPCWTATRSGTPPSRWWAIGSVGTACWVLLLMAGEGDPLFLQVKEARASVLEPYAGASVFRTTASAS